MARRKTKAAAPPGMRQMIGTAAAGLMRARGGKANAARAGRGWRAMVPARQPSAAPGRSPARAIVLGLGLALLAAAAVKEAPALQREFKIWKM